MEKKRKLKTFLGILSGIVALALFFVFWVYPDVPKASYFFGGLLIVLLAVQAVINQRELKEAVKLRSVRYGANALVTIGLVLAILIVVNFLNYNHFYRKDLTKGGSHSLSEQTIKILKELKTEVKVTVYDLPNDLPKAKDLLGDYKYSGGKKLSVEYVDLLREPTRARAAGIKKQGTVVLASATREIRVEEITEEKITNGLIRVQKEKTSKVCFLTGHGEREADQPGAESYSLAKREMLQQNYEVVSVNLAEKGKVPEDCSALLVLGPNKSFLDKELTVLGAWLAEGGRALFSFDTNIAGRGGFSAQAKSLLKPWHIEVDDDVLLDPSNQLSGVDPSAVFIKQFSTEHPIARDMRAQALFPFSSTINLTGDLPPTLKTWWIARSSPSAFAKTSFKDFASGRVTIDPKVDKAGPHVVMAAAEGSLDGKHKGRPARIVVLGTTQTGMNRAIGFGANLDLVMNSVSWLLEDNDLISIRAKEEGSEMPSMTQTQALLVQFITIIMMPLSILIAGLVIWLRRRKL